MKIGWSRLENEWRQQLLSYAKGNILEVGVGLGNNFKHYPIGAKVVATDTSARVIGQAKLEAACTGVKADFIVSPVEALNFPRHSFNTIVSTFSLCAYENPQLVLDKFNDWCKPDGVILLLEFGLSKYKMVSWFQKKWEPYHYRKTGSHLNRDMLEIISGSKLWVKKVEVRYAGIVYMVWATLAPYVNGNAYNGQRKFF